MIKNIKRWIIFCIKSWRSLNSENEKLDIFVRYLEPLSKYWIYFIIFNNKINIYLCHITRACATSVTTQINSQLLLVSNEISDFSKFYKNVKIFKVWGETTKVAFKLNPLLIPPPSKFNMIIFIKLLFQRNCIPSYLLLSMSQLSYLFFNTSI